MAIPADIQKRAEAWLNSPFDPDTQNQVRLLMQKPQELIDAFFCDLSFGTGGMRGLMGVGTNRLNIYTIQRATQGLANYINQKKKQEKLSLDLIVGIILKNLQKKLQKYLLLIKFKSF